MRLLLTAIAIAILAVLAYLGYRLVAGKRGSQAPLVSIVYLLQRPRQMSEDGVRACVGKALGVTFDVGNENTTEFVVALPPPPVNGWLR